MLRLICLLCLLCGPAQAQDAPPFATYMSASDAALNDPHDLAFQTNGNTSTALYTLDRKTGDTRAADMVGVPVSRSLRTAIDARSAQAYCGGDTPVRIAVLNVERTRSSGPDKWTVLCYLQKRYYISYTPNLPTWIIWVLLYYIL